MNDHANAHRCTQHNQAGCRLSHQATPYVRPDSPDSSGGIWALAEPAADTHGFTTTEWLTIAVTAFVTTVLIIFLAIAAGDAAADGFGPLLPTPTPGPEVSNP